MTTREPKRTVPPEEVAAAGYDLKMLGPGPFLAFEEDFGKGPQEVWRFPENRLVRWLANAMGEEHDRWRRVANREGEAKAEAMRPLSGLNQMFVAYAEEKFTLAEYMQFYRDMGYSLNGFTEVFGDLWLTETGGEERLCQKAYSEDEAGPIEICGEPEDGPIHTDDWLDTGRPHHEFEAGG